MSPIPVKSRVLSMAIALHDPHSTPLPPLLPLWCHLLPLTPWLTLPLANQHLSHSFSRSSQLPSQTCAGPSPGRLFPQVYFWPDPHFILVSDQMSPYQRGFPGSFHIKQHPYFPPWALSCPVACVILYHSIVTTLAVIYLSIQYTSPG